MVVPEKESYDERTRATLEMIARISFKLLARVPLGDSYEETREMWDKLALFHAEYIRLCELEERRR